jgi:hypothetical protein
MARYAVVINMIVFMKTYGPNGACQAHMQSVR